MILIDARDNSKLRNLSNSQIRIFYDSTIVDAVGPVISLNSHNQIDTVDVSSITLSGTVTDSLSGVGSVKVNGIDAGRTGAFWNSSIPIQGIATEGVTKGFRSSSMGMHLSWRCIA